MNLPRIATRGSTPLAPKYENKCAHLGNISLPPPLQPGSDDVGFPARSPRVRLRTYLAACATDTTSRATQASLRLPD
jgi:hypothetical protein